VNLEDNEPSNPSPSSQSAVGQPAVEQTGNFGPRRFRAKRPPDCARCSACGGDAISAYPTFSAGSGVAMRPYADDIICRKCGHIGPPAIVQA